MLRLSIERERYRFASSELSCILFFRLFDWKSLSIGQLFHTKTRLSMYSKRRWCDLYMSWRRIWIWWTPAVSETNKMEYRINTISSGLCNRTDSRRNVCDLTKARMCVETDAYGTSFACLCPGPGGILSPTTSWSCGKQWMSVGCLGGLQN